MSDPAIDLGPDRRLALDATRLRLERREGDAWRVELEEPFPIPPWRTRELARLILPAGGPIPVRPLPDAEAVRRMVAQLLGRG